jgi:hypothetical protein
MEERVMTTDLPLVSSFAEVLLSFAPAFSQRSFANRAATGLIVAAGAIGEKHFSCYHRFFSRANWSLDSLGHVVLTLVLLFIPPGAVILVAVDDTLARKTGKHIWGAGMHHDPLRSTRRKHFFSFGHGWVVLAIVIELPFAKGKRFAPPILFRLYRERKKKLPPGRPKGERKQCGETTVKEYRTRPELVAEMLAIPAGWLPGRRIRVVGDSEYSGNSVSRSLPEGTDLVGRMPMDAALHDKPGPRKPHQRGPNRKKGERLPNPAELAASRKVKWTKTAVDIHGRTARIWLNMVMHLALAPVGHIPGCHGRSVPEALHTCPAPALL